jgi:hypothetical protein
MKYANLISAISSTIKRITPQVFLDHYFGVAPGQAACVW